MIDDNDQQFGGRQNRGRSKAPAVWLPDDAQPDAYEIDLNKNNPVARKQRLIVFGGSFDPVHNGHIALAKHVLEHGLGDEVLFIPAAHSPLKDDVPHADGAHRIAMLQLAIEDALAQKKSYKRQERCAAEMVQKRDAVTGELVTNIHTGEKVMVESIPTIEVERDYQFSVSDIELQREGKSYTIDTLNLLKKGYRDYDIAFMVGSDCIDEISHWHRYGELLQQFTIIVYPRPNSACCPRNSAERVKIYKQLCETIGAHFAGKIVNAMLSPDEYPELDVSSTELRQAVVAGGDLSAYLPPSVWQYIQTNNLYTTL